MARSKKAGTRKGAPRRLAPHVEPVADEPEQLTYTVPELLLITAQYMSSSAFDDAKDTAGQAVQMAEANEDSKGMAESLEMLGMIQLELGELDEAREVSFLGPIVVAAEV
jgi:hypothetical protein